MSDEEDEKVEVVVAGHGGLRVFKGVDGDSAESSSKVIKRMLEEKSPTFLFKGPSEN